MSITTTVAVSRTNHKDNSFPTPNTNNSNCKSYSDAIKKNEGYCKKLQKICCCICNYFCPKDSKKEIRRKNIELTIKSLPPMMQLKNIKSQPCDLNETLSSDGNTAENVLKNNNLKSIHKVGDILGHPVFISNLPKPTMIATKTLPAEIKRRTINIHGNIVDIDGDDIAICTNLGLKPKSVKEHYMNNSDEDTVDVKEISYNLDDTNYNFDNDSGSMNNIKEMSDDSYNQH